MIRLTAVALLAGMLACAPKFEEPAVEFRSFSMEDMAQAEVKLSVRNPNRFPVDVRNLRYALLLTGDTVAAGARAEVLRVGAQDSALAVFPFEMRIGLADIIGRIPDIASDTVRLELAGQHSLPGLFGTNWRRFDYRRTIPLRPDIDKLFAPLRRLFDGD